MARPALSLNATSPWPQFGERELVADFVGELARVPVVHGGVECRGNANGGGDAPADAL